MRGRAMAGDGDLAVYLARFLQKDLKPGQNASRELFIKALPGMCEGASERVARAQEEHGKLGWERGWVENSIREAETLGLERAAETWRGLPEGANKEALGAYLKSVKRFNPEKARAPSERAMEDHAPHVMKGIRALATMDEHLRRCAEAGVDPGPAMDWALGPEESRAQVERLLERQSVEEACAPGRAGGAGAPRV